MKIEVKTDRWAYPVYLNEDGEFRCRHENIDVEEPCCSNPVDNNGNVTCGCYGSYSIYCNDCHNDDMQDFEADNLIEAYNERDEDWEYEQYRDSQLENA